MKPKLRSLLRRSKKAPKKKTIIPTKKTKDKKKWKKMHWEEPAQAKGKRVTHKNPPKPVPHRTHHTLKQNQMLLKKKSGTMRQRQLKKRPTTPQVYKIYIVGEI